MSGRRGFPAMCTPRAFASLLGALLVHSLLLLVSAQAPAPSRWQTLNGKPPLVVARGGFSGLFPDSSSYAYQFALLVSVPDVILWCDVQLTKDGVGVCAPDLLLDNSTNINSVYKNRKKTYLVNGVPTSGWFSLDFTLNELSSLVFVTQAIYTRSEKFDGNSPILPVQNVSALNPPGLWLNVQHDQFFTQHNLSMRSYVRSISMSRSTVVSYISSPEVGFLRSIVSLFPKETKLVFRFLGPDDVEVSTNQTYSSLLGNLTFIKTFASGILIHKDRIWPVDGNSYLQPHTSIVSDAHKAGLEVFASGFVNDDQLSYNYSYDPITECLHFVDNGDFSVDGVISDFPITPSEAFDCFSHQGKNASQQVDILVISKNGSSGDYPGCTDLAYKKAISDGADVIDCLVQMSKDGIPFCSESINLIDTTNVVQSIYSSYSQAIPAIKSGSGIYTFSLTWNQIQTLRPVILNPFAKYELLRNPKFKNAGNLMTLSDFLSLAKNASSLSGVLISIENAAYLIEEQGLAVTDKILEVLSQVGYDKKVLIESTKSSVLKKFKGKKNYEIVYTVDESIRDAADSAMDDIKAFADSVIINKESVFPDSSLFLTGVTNTVPKLRSRGLSVYVKTFSNEFVSQAWDFFSDPTVEINSYAWGVNISGVITDFPKTSARYKRNRCLSRKTLPPYMVPVQPGGLLQLMLPAVLPPVEPPYPLLTESDVVEAPLPSAKAIAPVPGGGTTAVPPAPSNGHTKIAARIFLLNMAILFNILLLL